MTVWNYVSEMLKNVDTAHRRVCNRVVVLRKKDNCQCSLRIIDTSLLFTLYLQLDYTVTQLFLSQEISSKFHLSLYSDVLVHKNVVER